MRRKQYERLMNAVSLLDKRQEDLHRRMEVMEKAVLSIHDHMNDCAKFKVPDERGASELMQEGIDAIMSYEWPRKKGGNG